MPPPLPIPSKAAIHALRGIALGTSCAIGVILEDRRRRISTLKTALSNKEKLKAVKRYHSVADPTPARLDETAFAEGDQFQWHHVEDDTVRTRDGPSASKTSPQQHSPEDASPDTNPAPSVKTEDGLESPSTTTTQAETSSSQTTHHDVAVAHILNTSRQQLWPSETEFDAHKTWGTYQALYSSPMLKIRLNKRRRAIADVTSILDSNDEERLDQALRRFLDACRGSYSEQLDEQWIELSIRLSRDFHAENRLEDAAKILLTILGIGPLEESQFFAHQPIPLINYYLRQVDENGRVPQEAVSTATRIFLATLKEKPQMRFEELEEFGMQLMTENFMLGQFSLVGDVYWRVIAITQSSEFMGWAIQMLHEHRDHKHVLKYFLLNFSKTTPDARSYFNTVDSVVSSVEALGGMKAEHVLDALCRMDGAGTGIIRSRWVMKLLHAYWNRNRDFPTLKALFDAMLSIDILDRVTNSNLVYRTMVELSIKAEMNDVARLYCEELLEKFPDMTTDVTLKGLFILPMAKAGDWDGVSNAFAEMQTLRRGQEDEYDKAFIQILKIFAESHTASEVRDFVSHFISHLGVRMHRYIVTLVANKYGQCHDSSGFVSWLQYCSEVGFAMDSSFCNSVLHNCHAKWAMPYNELRNLYTEFERLDVSFDDVTRRILSQAALKGSKTDRNGNAVNRAQHPSHIAVDRLAYAGHTSNRRDVYEAMKQELSNSNTATAISIYQNAIRFGMPPCPHCLRLATFATLKNGKNGSASAMQLLQIAYDRGEDISSAVSEFIKFQLNNLQAEAKEALLHMRNLITQFEALHIVIVPDILTRMALFCVKLGNYSKALALCNLAVDKSGTENLCFSRECFKALLMTYPALRDLEGTEKLMEDLLQSNFAGDRPVYLYLKRTIKLVKKMAPDRTTDAIIDILEHGRREVARRREKIRRESKNIANETLRIMKDALSDMRGLPDGEGPEELQWQ
ncbi:uncharacterized protein F4812DRAFT_424772 [Daldinia caldariorum]|uniref:uncharacterized protein n=1 Tax=Daldinia caldariorum TaxID=326644 RepID=UPI0020084C9B|nr:uncharacterized protein F4812DRAFT_424772 [Daldinia caldariorum]KAI1468804.1 hypothetical protein F4812DRAFT_424772 [Daldinia caldariorum]